MVVATATDVGVLYRRAVRDLLLRVGSVEAVLEDRGDGAVASRADVIAAPTGSFEPVDSIFLGEPQDAEAGAESLLGMRLRAHDRFEQRERCRTDLLSLSHEARWRPLGIAPMRARHMFWDRRVPVGGEVALPSLFFERLGHAGEPERDQPFVTGMSEHRVSFRQW